MYTKLEDENCQYKNTSLGATPTSRTDNKGGVGVIHLWPGYVNRKTKNQNDFMELWKKSGAL